jgi:hypothetical protein
MAAFDEGDRIAVVQRGGRVAEEWFFSLPQFLAKAMRKTRYAYLDKNSRERRDALGAGTTGATGGSPYVSSDVRPVFMLVERPALDEGSHCRLWPACGGLIHEYQTDASSKPPAPGIAKQSMTKDRKKHEKRV